MVEMDYIKSKGYKLIHRDDNVDRYEIVVYGSLGNANVVDSCVIRKVKSENEIYYTVDNLINKYHLNQFVTKHIT